MALRRNRGDEPLDGVHEGLSSAYGIDKPIEKIPPRGYSRLIILMLVVGYIPFLFYFRTVTSARDEETRTTLHSMENSFAKVEAEMKHMATELEERKRMLEEKQKGEEEKGEYCAHTALEGLKVI